MGRLPRKPAELPGRALAAALALVACAGAPPGRVVVGDGRYAMGTALELRVVAADPESGRALLDRLFARVEAVESQLSTWRPQSAASLLNARAGEPPAPVPDELYAVLREAVRGAEATGGAFDVTVGPLLALWGEAARRGVPPAPAELAAARERVGWRGIVLRPGGRAGLAREGMAIDLGGIGKGYALDRLVPELRSSGVDSALLSFGQSSVVGLGRPPDADAWRLAVEHPAGGVLAIVELGDRALSVSSSLGQFAEIGGVRYGHVVDPRSGEALTEGRLALVVAPTATEAEVYSTALLVLGAAFLPRLPSHVSGLVLGADGTLTTTPGLPAVLPGPGPLEPPGPGAAPPAAP